jgi:hypothetical protein
VQRAELNQQHWLNGMPRAIAYHPVRVCLSHYSICIHVQMHARTIECGRNMHVFNLLSFAKIISS